MASAASTSLDKKPSEPLSSPQPIPAGTATDTASSMMSRPTLSPLPDNGALPEDFVDHLLLITQSLVNSKPPASLRGTYAAEGSGSHSATPRPASTPTGANDQNAASGASAASSFFPPLTSLDNSNKEATVSLPLPRFHFEGGDHRTQAIEANIGKLVERLWRAEDQLETVSKANSGRRVSGNAQQSRSALASSNGTAANGSAGPSSEAMQRDAKSDQTDSRRSSLADFPYPLAHAQPQSSDYPLSYPLGMGEDGPVLLSASDPAGDPETAVDSFHNYNDESGLSAQEELRLLKAQVQDIARVCKAVAFGDLSQHITVPVQGHVMAELKEIINQMVDRLSNFATEVTRVSLEVGTEGKLGGQVEVEGVEGRWKELKDVVNRLAANLTTQVRGVALVTKVSS